MSTIPRIPPHPALIPGEPVPAPSREQQEIDRAFYPETDGKRMAENTLQYDWIEMVNGNIEAMLADDPNVFVAGDLLWYPVENEPRNCTAPDTMVAFGRPKGPRGSYLQWREAGIPPRVAFEILSPSSTAAEMDVKRGYYERYGVLEHYHYSPFTKQREGWWRESAATPFEKIAVIEEWTSPLLGIRFAGDESGGLRVLRPDGRPFATFVEINRRSEANERGILIANEQREAAEAQIEAAIRRNEALAARLRALGIDPDEIT